MGDPAGVGPEVVLHALHDSHIGQKCQLIVFGDHSILSACAMAIGLPQPDVEVLSAEEFGRRGPQDFSGNAVVDFGNLPADRLVRCQVSQECGRASYEYIQAAIDAALVKHVDAVTTAPINKAALHRAGICYPGHTEMFAERAATGPWCMMQYSPEITCSFVTVHVGYHEVPSLLSQQSILDTIQLTADALVRIRGYQPHLVVCGLNPHAGEGGLFGNREEERFICPAIEQARRRGLSVEGPLPPDTAFLPSKRQQTDAFVCMYHDQGHIPVKALAFDSAVNTSLGLKIIRTSVDHGTAFDIAWQGTAKPDSLFAAINLACNLSSS